ncbi:MAG: hypothetical protein WB947_08155 [Thermoplasmata archaeon]
MSRRPASLADETSPGALARWADRSHWFVLPLTGAVSFGVGLSLVFGRNLPGGGYVPVLLVVLGVGALASALAGVAARSSRVPSTSVAPARVISESWVICPSCSARSSDAAPHPTAAPVRDAPPMTWLLPAHSEEMGPVTPGDTLWASWIPEVGKMPVELVGPVPETANVPHREGTPRLYEEGEPIALDLPLGGIATLLGAGNPFQGRDPASPLDSNYSDVEEIEAEVEANATAGTSAMDPSDGRSVSDLTIADEVLWEALNPTPPHLRAGAQRVRPMPPERRTLAPPVYGGVRCVDCRNSVGEAASPHHCFLCRRRLCSDCMANALRTTEGGCCSYCAALQGFAVLSRGIRPNARTTAG